MLPTYVLRDADTRSTVAQPWRFVLFQTPADRLGSLHLRATATAATAATAADFESKFR